MEVECFTLGPAETNTYLFTNTSSCSALVVDPGLEPTPLLAKIQQKQLTIRAILLTHAHFDHIAGLDDVRAATGAPVYVHAAETDWLQDPMKNGSSSWIPGGIRCRKRAENSLDKEETLSLDPFRVGVLLTPGHSPGGITYRVEYEGNSGKTAIFCGDLLFRGSVGRTDLYGGDTEVLKRSLWHLGDSIDPQMRLYPGHGPETTWRHELRTNPWLEDRAER